MDLQVKFANPQQRAFFYATQRNQCFSGGFNNGKTYVGCLKAFTLLTTFPKYRVAIARQVLADLKRTTMQTFFKICPHELIERHNEQDGLTVLKNGSQINWMHLDKVDESSLRGLEINSVLVDQAEETEEKVYDVLDARIGRWDGAEIPEYLLRDNPDWPRSKQGKLLAPSYIMLLCNPDTQYHYIFRKYHPDSLEREFSNFFIEGQWDSTLGSEESYEKALGRGEEWVEKYVKGRWGLSDAQIHRVSSDSLLEPTPELIDRILKKGNLFRSMDHGESAPTCCLWFAALGGVFICYREYYLGNEVISHHRKNIVELSGDERYTANYADPQIFKKESQRTGGFWSVADEYLTRDIPEPPLFWLAADNNEYATRNRINELLRHSKRITHPVTSQENAPGLYFVTRTPDYPHGAYQSIKQIQSQRRKLVGYVDGRSEYCDEREDGITDHAYDPVRYFIAMHGSGKTGIQRPVSKNSFKWFQMMKKRKHNLEAMSA